MKEVLLDEAAERKVGIEVWFMDEARRAKGSDDTDLGDARAMPACPVRPQVRVRIPIRHRLRGPRRRRGPMAEAANTESTGEFLRKPGEAARPGTRVGFVLDGAGRRSARSLAVPENVSLLFLPSGSPKINPMEHVILCLKDNRFANRVFEGAADLTEAVARRGTSSPARPAGSRGWCLGAGRPFALLNLNLDDSCHIGLV